MYLDGESKVHYVKRFKIETSTLAKRFLFISKAKGSKMLAATANPEPLVEVKFQKDKKAEKEAENCPARLHRRERLEGHGQQAQLFQDPRPRPAHR